MADKTEPFLDQALKTIAGLQTAVDHIKGTPLDERPKFEAPYNTARRIVCEEWQAAVKEFGLQAGSLTERVVSRIINRLDETVWPAQ
jgi:hypothetical protein